MFKSKPRVVREPNRETLAEAIAQATEAEHVAEAARTAVTRANDFLASATARLETAAGNVARAKDTAMARLSSAASGGDTLAPDGALREARGAERDARDEVDAARAALATVEAAATEAEYQLGQARKLVGAAVKPVLAGEADRLIAEIEKLEAQAWAKRAALAFLHAEACKWPPSDRDRRVQSLLTCVVYPRSPVDHPAYGLWREARDVLLKNADASLPE